MSGTINYKGIIAICVLSGLGAQLFPLMPVLVGALADSRGYGVKDLGTIAAVAGLGSLIMGITSPLWLKFVRLRSSLALLAVASAIATALLPRVGSVGGLIAAMTVLGALLGAVYTTMFAAVALSSHPERVLGWKLGTESLPGLLLLYVASNFIVRRYGFDGVAYLSAGSCLVLGGAAMLLPNTPIRTEGDKAAAGDRPGASFWLALAAALVQWAGVSAVWVFMERIGTSHGLSASASGAVFVLGWIGASAGGLAAAGFGDRFGMLKPFLAAIIVSGVALFLFQTSAIAFLVAAPVFLTTSVFASVYAFSLATMTSRHASYAALGAAAAQAAVAIGPEMGGRAYAAASTIGALTICAVCFVISVGLYIAAQGLRPTVAAVHEAEESEPLDLCDLPAPR